MEFLVQYGALDLFWIGLSLFLIGMSKGGFPVGNIALPILIFIIKFGWPRIREFFNKGMTELEGGALDAAGK